MIRRIIELEKWRLTKKYSKFSSTSGKSAAENFFFKNFLLAQKMRLEISGAVKFRIQGHLGVGKGEKHPLGQNCPKADATVNLITFNKWPGIAYNINDIVK